jgi:lysophospholipase
MTTLFQSENNPAPDAHVDGHVETADGFSIRYAVFRSQGNRTRGTIVLLQGRNETIEKYYETIGDLMKEGFDVVAFDWRGQGGSSRFFRNTEPGYVETFDQYAADLETVFSDVVLPDSRPPFFILAHSTGALVALYSAPAMVNRVRRMVLSAPFLGLPISSLHETVLRAATTAMDFFGLGTLYVSGGSARNNHKPFEMTPLTSDSGRYTRNIAVTRENPSLALGGPTAAWMNAVFHAIDHVRRPEHMAHTIIPTLVVMAGAERVVSNAAIEAHVSKLRSASLLTIDGARHELLQEADRYREPFLAAVKAFVPGSGE